MNYHKTLSKFITLSIFREIYYFFLKNFFAAIYGIIFIVIIYLSNFIHFYGIARFDIIFVTIVLLQVVFISLKIESKNDFLVICIFHIVATVMEVFKTSGSIGSWQYPWVGETIFHIYNVPLFTGFMYSAIGSYITRAQHCLNLRYIHYPKHHFVILLWVLIYINFFAHHFLYDFRFFLIAGSFFLFFPTYVEFQVYKKKRKIHFITSALLTAVVVWIAENISTFYKIWLYPNQLAGWEMVSFSKVTAWYMLLIVSFAIISSLKKFRID